MDTDLLYFDTTSTYLEGTHPEGLAKFGYSRDKRKDREAMRSAGLPYIVATRLRSDKRVTEELLARAGPYQTVAENFHVQEVHRKEGEDRYIVCLNPLSVEEDQRNREGIVAYLEKKLAGRSTENFCGARPAGT